MIFDWELIREGLTPETVGYGVVLPMAIVGLATAMAHRLPAERGGLLGLVSASALALAVIIGYAALNLGPLVVRHFGNKWLPHLVVLAVPAGWYAGRNGPASTTGLIMGMTALAAAFPLEAYSLVMQVFWAVVLGYASWVSAMTLLYARLPSSVRALSMVLTAITASMVLFAAGLSRMTHIAGLLGSACSGATVVFLWRGDSKNRLVRGLAPGFAVLLSGLMFCGYLGQGALLPPSVYVLVALSPVALLVSRLAPEGSPWWRGGIPALLVLIGVQAVVLIRVIRAT
jgi:hypothetical protein